MTEKKRNVILTHIKPSEQILYLSLILQYSQIWVFPNEPQENVQHESDRTLTQICVKKKYRKKECNQIFQNITNMLQNTYYKLLEQKRAKILFLIEIKQSQHFEYTSCISGTGNLGAPSS